SAQPGVDGSPFQQHSVRRHTEWRPWYNGDGRDHVKSTALRGSAMANDLVHAELRDHLALNKNAPALFVEDPAIGNHAPLQFFFARFLLAGILLFEHRELVRVARRAHADQFAEKTAKEFPVFFQ